MRCEDCKFYGYIGDGHGFCHRNPPQVLMVKTLYGVADRSYFPEVHAADWCGEFADDRSNFPAGGNH